MDRVLSLLGIAQKAGKVVSGGFLCEDAIKSREAVLVILAEDAQKNTVHTIRGLADGITKLLGSGKKEE